MKRPLVDVVVIGGMKCGTTALHGYLAEHPEVVTSHPKELDYFFGERPGGAGNHWRGPGWYRGRFPSGGGLRVEASPGYTSPDHPGVAARIAAEAPEVRLLYLFREPLDRAVSQYLHHHRDGDERRPVGEALLDPDSQYLARSRHHERLEPFLRRFPAERIALIDHADLLRRRRATLRAVFGWLGIDPDHWSPGYRRRRNVAPPERPGLPADVARRFTAAVADDDRRLRRLLARRSSQPDGLVA